MSKTEQKSLQVRVWTPSKKHSETGCLKQCNIFENASQNGSLNRYKIDEKTDLGTPATTEPHFGIPGKALGVPPHENVPKSTENMFQNMETFPKMITSENIP